MGKIPIPAAVAGGYPFQTTSGSVTPNMLKKPLKH